MHFFKKTVAAVLSLLMLAAVPAGAASAAQEAGDPGSGRLSGSYIPAEFYGDAGESILPALGADEDGSVNSPFKNAHYTHSERHTKCQILNGIDISSYQPTVDWKKASAAGVDFAILRVGYRGYGSAGTLVADTCFTKHAANAAAAGVPIGVYIYSQAITEDEAREEAQFILDRIGKYNIELPVVLDYEYASVGSTTGGRLYNAGLTAAKATAICNAFCAKVEEAGYTAMVYANKSMLTNQLNAGEISSKYKIWLAQYNTAATYTGDYEYWQYTSTGAVDGISGNIDCNFWYIEVPAVGISLDHSTRTVKLNDTLKLMPSLMPYNATSPVRWSSSDTSVLTVDSSGVVHPVSVGSAVVTANAGSYSDSCTVTVTASANSIVGLDLPDIDGVVLSDISLRLETGKTAKLTAAMLSNRTQGISFTWTTSNRSVARVSADGTVTAVAAGDAVITAIASEGGYTATCNVKVGPSITSIKLSPVNLSLGKGGKSKLTAVISPTSASSFWQPEYTSSDTSVATVSSDGTVTAVALGSAIITATAGGKKAECEVTVSPQQINTLIPVKLSAMNSSSYKNVSISMKSKANGSIVTGNPEWNAQGAQLNINVTEGEYAVTVSKSGYLSYTDNSYTIGYGTNAWPVLYAGDINGDGCINALDAALMTYAMDNAVSSVLPDADYDGNGKINSSDCAALLANYGKTAPVVD